MANNNTSGGQPNTFDKELQEDVKNFHSEPNSWSQARNAIPNSKQGDLGSLGNEPATLHCIQLPNPAYTIIGTIHIVDDRWLIFSSLMPVNTQFNPNISLGSEIGIFDASQCKYDTLIEDPLNCLQFNTAFPIIGVAKRTSLCTYKAYWDDRGHNPDRVIEFDIENLENNLPFLPGTTTTNPNTTIPYIQTCVMNGTCLDCTTNVPAQLDCDKIRLARYIKTPCISVKKGIGSGSLPNGSYMVAVSYSIAGQKVGDWFISNVQSLFDHDNVAGSLDIEITNTDNEFDELTVVVVSIVNQQTAARTIGQYSTRQQLISIDSIQTTWPIYPIEQLPIRTPVIERSDAMYTVNDYLLRVGPRSKFDFNYQPLANQIVAKWIVTEFPENYYRNGGNKTGYLRDEVYAFFIRWIYDTGDKSSSYHIPGRPKLPTSAPYLADNTIAGLGLALPNIDGNNNEIWFGGNTARQIGNTTQGNFPDINGVTIAEGIMSYWESSEKYPDNKPEIWDASANTWSDLTTAPNANPYTGAASADYDLCGKPIRHHKMPDQTIPGQNPDTTNPLNLVYPLDYFNPNNNTIRILGTKFENIRAPMMVDSVTGNTVPVPGIVGYEILRGSRNGNRTIVAKGILNNMMKYQTKYQDPNNPFNYLSDQFPGERLYQNYPYNDLRDDPFLSETETNVGSSTITNIVNLMSGNDPNTFIDNFTPLGGVNNVKQDVFSFHSPDTNFIHPFLSAKELKTYSQVTGNVTGKFEKSEKHPKEVLITNTAFIISAIAGIGLGALAVNGKRSVKYFPGGSRGFSQVGWEKIRRANSTFNSVIYTGPMSETISGDDNITGSAASNGDSGSAGAQPKPSDESSISDPNNPTTIGANATINELINQLEANFGNTLSTDLLNATGSGTTTPTYKDLLEQLRDIANTNYALQTPYAEITQEDGITKSMPSAGAFTMKLPIFLHYLTEGTDNILRMIRAYIPDSDFALRYHSHCFYDSSIAFLERRELLESGYIGAQVTKFGQNFTINNLYRNSFVALQLNSIIVNPTINDITRIRASDVDKLWSPGPLGKALIRPSDKSFTTSDSYGAHNGNPSGLPSSGVQVSSCYYGAIKQNIRNLYGQLIQISQQPASSCVETNLPTPPDLQGNGEVAIVSGNIYGGDIYVGRYTEKNTFFFFADWLYEQPDGTQFNYPSNSMIAYPRFWANFDRFETTDFTSSLIGGLTNPAQLITNGITTPSDYYNLDGYTQVQLFNSFIPLLPSIGSLSIKWQWFYLFNSGIRDFYCESEINLDLRDWGNLEDQRHFDPFNYSDTKAMFDTKIIKSHNYYKYDFSLSISKLFGNYISWGNMQNRYYDPTLAQTCFQYTPNRVIYSLPDIYGSYADNWLTFLPNNYKDFASKITSIKGINKSGAIIFFESMSPVEFQGLDQLQTTLGVKLTIGDGGLFSQPMQALINTDAPYEYGSCQNRLSIINTPSGLFWMCQNQGKIFTLGKGINELSSQDLRWWMAQYLPYKLTQLFPKFELTDNTISGIGCQSIYDNENSLVYFCKKDYILLPGFIPSLTYDPITNPNPTDGNIAYLGGFRFFDITNSLYIALGNPTYFEDISWTISYDPKTGSWIGYHDWHPNLLLPGKNTFMSISNVGQDPTQTPPGNLNSSIWIHNERTDLYCNYYGFDKPFEIEFLVNSGQQVTTLRSVQYVLECYFYDPNEYDRFHILDSNFDEATIYNTEQCSGLLKLILKPKNNPGAEFQYPIINSISPGSNIQILFTKEENKYRFNTFFDITDDRGEFNPIAQRMIWNTAENGYVRVLNDLNLDYNKSNFERKKFRHYKNSIILRKLVSGSTKMLVQIFNTKYLQSAR